MTRMGIRRTYPSLKPPSPNWGGINFGEIVNCPGGFPWLSGRGLASGPVGLGIEPPPGHEWCDWQACIVNPSRVQCTYYSFKVFLIVKAVKSFTDWELMFNVIIIPTIDKDYLILFNLKIVYFVFQEGSTKCSNGYILFIHSNFYSQSEMWNLVFYSAIFFLCVWCLFAHCSRVIRHIF